MKKIHGEKAEEEKEKRGKGEEEETEKEEEAEVLITGYEIKTYPLRIMQ